MRFPINRACPLTGEAVQEAFAYVSAGAVAAGNPTYRTSFANILAVSPEDEFPIVESSAGFVFSGWLPPDAFLRRVYEEVVDSSATMSKRIFYNAVLDFANAFYAIATRCGPAPKRRRRLLDYGCGYGLLLRVLAGGELDAIGYEPSAIRRESAASGVCEIFNNLDQVAAVGPFDLFICTEVLEHLPDPRAALRYIRRNAAPGALLGVSVPCCERSFVDACLKQLAEEDRLPSVLNPWEHLNYFSAASLRRLLAEEGFKVINDYGRTSTVRDACPLFGDSEMNPVINSLRILKRATMAKASTQLFCVIA